jgi:hypothetical protein
VQIAYWIVVAPLALLHLYAGGRKVAQSREQLEPMMGWVDTVPMPLVRSIGVVEILGVVGLVLPPLSDVAPVLAPVAALGFVVLQVLAAGVHLSRGETKDIRLNIALIVLATLAAWLATAW